MTPKKRLSSAFVFVSVLFGSFMGAAITLLSTPKSGKDLKDKVKGTADVLKEDMNEKIDRASLRLIENTPRVIMRARMKMDGVNSFVHSIRDNLRNTFKKNKR